MHRHVLKSISKSLRTCYDLFPLLLQDITTNLSAQPRPLKLTGIIDCHVNEVRNVHDAISYIVSSSHDGNIICNARYGSLLSEMCIFYDEYILSVMCKMIQSVNALVLMSCVDRCYRESEMQQ